MKTATSTSNASTKGMKKDTRVADALNLVLADSYALMALTHQAHWNVEGSDFFQLHKAFQEQYENLFEAIDEIAEQTGRTGHDDDRLIISAIPSMLRDAVHAFKLLPDFDRRRTPVSDRLFDSRSTTSSRKMVDSTVIWRNFSQSTLPFEPNTWERLTEPRQQFS